MKTTAFVRGASCAALSLLVSAASVHPVQAAGEVNIYSYRQAKLIKPLLDDFTKSTGIKTNVIVAKKGLIERMKAEGRNSPADVLLSTDIARLTGAVTSGVAQPVSSGVLDAQIPAAYRDPAGQWFGLTRRVRFVLASKARVAQDTITYEELADPKWKGRICIRSGQHVYNVALIASMIANLGEEKAKAWLEGVKSNLARKPAGNDRAQAKGVYSGECDLAIANTYYLGLMQTNEKKPQQKKWAEAIKPLFPNASGRGSHVNLSGMVLAKHAPHRANAVKLMEYLASDRAQELYASVNFEYPVSPNVAWSKRVKSWGTFKADPIALSRIAELRKRASELVDEVAFNDGPGT